MGVPRKVFPTVCPGVRPETCPITVEETWRHGVRDRRARGAPSVMEDEVRRSRAMGNTLIWAKKVAMNYI